MSENSSDGDFLELPDNYRPRSNSDNVINYNPLIDQDSANDLWLARPRTPPGLTSRPGIQHRRMRDSHVAEMLARNLLLLSIPVCPNLRRDADAAGPAMPARPPAPAPLVVEDPPSSEEDEELRSSIRPSASFLDGTPSCSTPPIIIVNEDNEVEGTDSSPPSTPSPKSSTRSIFYVQSSGSLLAKSAPSTPQGERLLQPTPHVPPVQRSPSHVFNRQDRQALKQLSASAPVMTQAQAAARPQPANEPVLTTAPAQESGSSKSRQKKFHRHFKTVSPEERVLNYYSCALVGDILLQGHLYITKNYFAFYSNVFGYVTKLLIPTVSVLKVSKEKTARIIPNAIGVATGLEKHVFGSLLSRDSTYRLMMQVWKEAIAQGPKLPITITKVIKDADSVSGDINLPDDEDSSLSGSERSCPPTPLDCPTDLSHSESCVADGPKLPIGSMVPGAKHILLLPKRDNSVSRPTLLLAISTGLLVLLFLSAAFLLYRIGRIHNQFVENPLLTSRSANEVQEFLNSNLDQLIKVRQSLEVLSQLILMEGENVVPQQRQQKDQGKKSEDNRELPRDRHS